jgi:DNA-binding transcriptional LysR family regulator
MQRNNVTLKQLRGFVAVADKGSFVAAAEAMALSQPALSQSIRELEGQIGAPLFHRTTRSVRLTGIGLGFLTSARHLLRQIDLAVAEAREGAERSRGRVVVACLPSIAYRVMPQAIAASEAAFPGMRVIVQDGNFKTISDAVAEGKADIGIGSFPVATHSFDGVVIARDRFFAVLPRKHPLAGKRSLKWADLAGVPFIAMSQENGLRELVDNAVASRNISLTLISEVSNIATAYGLLEQGVGVTALPGLALPAEEHPALEYRPLTAPVVERTIRAVWRHGVGLSPGARAILQSIRQAIGDGRLPTANRVEWLQSGMPAPRRAPRRARSAAVAGH